LKGGTVKKFILGFALLTGLSFAQNAPTKASKILSAATATGAGEVFQPWGPQRSYHALGTTSSGSGAASINIQVSNDCTNYITVGTIALTLGTTATSDGFVTDANWKCVRANVASISGTGAAVDVWIGN
jgi:hypothetical protein